MWLTSPFGAPSGDGPNSGRAADGRSPLDERIRVLDEM
jgi:hypothetical protein